jgi:hypothetical protein
MVLNPLGIVAHVSKQFDDRTPKGKFHLLTGNTGERVPPCLSPLIMASLEP